MSEPFTGTSDNPIQTAIHEMISAMSALNMEPDPIPVPDDGQIHFLSERDKWAAHCMEHLHSAFQLLNQAHSENLRLKDTIHRIRVAIAEVKTR